MGYKYKAHTHLAWLEKISITYLGMSVFPESVEEKKKKTYILYNTANRAFSGKSKNGYE